MGRNTVRRALASQGPPVYPDVKAFGILPAPDRDRRPRPVHPARTWLRTWPGTNCVARTCCVTWPTSPIFTGSSDLRV